MREFKSGAMNLRAKIFLSVGGLFFLGFVVVQILEGKVTSKNLIEEEKLLHDQILHQDELRRKNMELYIRDIVEEDRQNIHVLLSKIRDYPELKSRFSPSIDNIQNGTWLASATLLNDNKWIDCIQNTNEGIITSQIVINQKSSNQAILFKLDPRLKVCITKLNETGSTWDGPYIAIPYNYELLSFQTITKPVEDGEGYFLLFKPQAIRDFNCGDLEKKVQESLVVWKSLGVEFSSSSNYYEVLQGVVSGIKEAQDYLQENADTLQMMMRENNSVWITALIHENPSLDLSQATIPIDLSIAEQMSIRFDQIANIWQLSTVEVSKIFGIQPFVPAFPEGIAQIQSHNHQGSAFLKHNLILDQFKLNSSTASQQAEETKDMSTIIYKDLNNRLYFGEILYLKEAGDTQIEREGTLTLAIDGKDTVRLLALATNASTFFVSGGQILSAFDQNGSEMMTSKLNFPLDSIANQLSGFVTIGGVDYFFLLLRPYENLDFNFYIISPKNQEFALATTVSQSAKTLTDKILNQTRLIVVVALIVVLFMLNNIAKHITHPIALLGGACKLIGEGKLSEIELPELNKRHNDEVYTLYASFKDMVRGLKEKEKVMGALNKVVSPTIAQEILKGNVHLGGEEKIVTVLFADIRHFTKISENMKPADLITMLNACMTKVSHAVDKHGGVIDKFVGDEVMALFGAPVTVEHAAIKAIECGLEIAMLLKEWNKERQAEGLPTIEMGVGIHTGIVVAGNMGAEDRLNYTVLGAGVNLAARICSVAEAAQVLISQGTVHVPEVMEYFDLKPLPPIELKGFSVKEPIFEVLGVKKNS